MMNTAECPYFQQPIASSEYKIYEGIAWCDLSDNQCMVYYGEPSDCDEFMELLKEANNNGN